LEKGQWDKVKKPKHPKLHWKDRRGTSLKKKGLVGEIIAKNTKRQAVQKVN